MASCTDRFPVTLHPPGKRDKNQAHHIKAIIMKPKIRPVVLIVVLTMLAVAVLRGQHQPSGDTEQAAMPHFTVMLNFNTIIQ